MKFFELAEVSNEEIIHERCFRAFLMEAYAREVAEGIVTIVLQYVVVGHRTKNVFAMQEELLNDVRNLKSKTFFGFLSESKIKFDDYDDLVGLTFDANVVYEQYNHQVFPTFVDRKLVHKPIVN